MENQANSSLPDLSAMISKVMANPEAIAMLTSLLGGQAPKKTATEDCHEDQGEACQEARILPAPPPKASVREERKQLLLALKPFLSKDRCEAIDRILLITDTLSLLQTEKKR